jgi:hypothetical protein
MSDDQPRTIHAETGPDFSAEICNAAKMGDLSPAAISDFRSRWAKKASNPRLLNLTDEQPLLDAELLIDNGLTFAALILFGEKAALGRHIGQAEVVFEYRSSEATGPAQNRVDNRMGLSLFRDHLWNRIELRNDQQITRKAFSDSRSPRLTKWLSARQSSMPSVIGITGLGGRFLSGSIPNGSRLQALVVFPRGLRRKTFSSSKTRATEGSPRLFPSAVWLSGPGRA